MKTKDRLLRAVFVGMAVAIAWFIRGDYGGIWGVGFCGAMLGTGFAYVSGQRNMFKWMPLLAGVAAVTLYSCRSYWEPFHGYATNKTFVNYAYGFFMLILQGGGWGCFACCLIGLMLETKPLRASEWASVVATVLVAIFVFYYVVVDLIGFHVTTGPLRTDKVIGLNGGVIGLFVWLILSKKHYGLKGAFFGYIGFGLGVAGGRFVANVRDYGTWTIGDWYVLQGLFGRFENIMEFLTGLIGGTIFTYGMLGKKAPDFPEDKHSKLLSIYSIFFLLAGIPIVTRIMTMSGDIHDGDTGGTKLAKWTQRIAPYHADPAALASMIPTVVSIVCVLATIGAVVWLFLYLRDKHRFAAFPVLCLSATMIVMQNIEHQYLLRPFNQGWKGMLFAGTFLLMLLHVIFIKKPEVTEPDEVAERVNWGRWLLGVVVVYAFIVALSGPVNAGRKGDVSRDHYRFPAGDVQQVVPWGRGG